MKRPLAYITAPWSENEFENPYAARVVCDIFRMRLEGASASKIASELNQLGILSPLAYKKNNGLPYAKKGYADKADCKWSATTIIRILQDETYTGTLVQGKQGTPHYKIKQMEQRPASEWVRVPDAHKALIARQDFELVQRIKGLDTRTSPNEDTVYLFSGILICGCCGSRMTRKTNRANGKEYHYYYCPTGKKKGCAHPVMLKESSLIDCVRDSLKAYIGNIASLEALLTGIDQTSINQALAKEYSDHITDNERRLEQVLEFKARLYESLVGGMLTKEEYASYKAKYTKQAEDIRESVRVLKEKLTEVLENRSERNRWISQFTQFSTLETLDRRALIHMVQSICFRTRLIRRWGNTPSPLQSCPGRPLTALSCGRRSPAANRKSSGFAVSCGVYMKTSSKAFSPRMNTLTTRRSTKAALPTSPWKWNSWRTACGRWMLK